MRFWGSRSFGNRSEGFTLIELVVALAVLGIGLGVLMQLLSGGLRSARVSEEYTKATWYGKTKMEEILSAKHLSEGVAEDRFDSGYFWKVEVKKDNPSLGLEGSEAPKLPVDLYRVVVTIRWPSGNGWRSLQMESFRVFREEKSS